VQAGDDLRGEHHRERRLRGIVSPRDIAPAGHDLWVAAFAESDAARIRLR